MTNLLAASNVRKANDNSPVVPVIARNGKSVFVRHIKGRDRKLFGRVHPGSIADHQHADIMIGESVRLHGINYNRIGDPVVYSIEFRVGDTAIYDSYNLDYTGPITAITEKGVAITDMHGKTRRLGWHEFNWRNWDYSAEEVFQKRANFMD